MAILEKAKQGQRAIGGRLPGRDTGEGRKRLTIKERDRTFWGEGNIPYLDCSDDYTTI